MFREENIERYDQKEKNDGRVNFLTPSSRRHVGARAQPPPRRLCVTQILQRTQTILCFTEIKKLCHGFQNSCGVKQYF